MKKVFSNIFILLFVGLIIRLIFIPAPGFEADIAYWKWWGEAAGKGPAYAVLNSSNNYPPVFIMFLGLIWKFYTLLAPLETAKNLYQTNTFIFLLVVKLPAIICDLISSYLIYYLLKKITSQQWNNGTMKQSVNKVLKKSKLLIPIIGAALYLFNPVVIFDSAYWGQTDSIAVVLVLFALIAFLKQKIWLTFIIATIALETKTQTVVFAPFFFLLTFRWFGLKKTIEAFSVCAATFLIINFPYIATNTLVHAISRILDSASYFPQASLNAYNFWWIIAKGNGFTTSDATLIGNAVTYKSFGMLAYWGVYILIGIYLWIKTKPQNNVVTMKQPASPDASQGGSSNETINHLKTISLAFSVAAFSFYMLPTQIHERYIFPFFLFFAIFVSLNYLISKKLFLISVLIFALCAFSSFLNLHLVLVMNYPQNGFPILTDLNKAGIYLPLTMILSWLNVILFILLLWTIIKQIPPKIFWIVISALVIVFLGQLALDFTKRQLVEISLVSLKPISNSQDWGDLQKNKSVDKRLLSGTYVWYKYGLGTHANSRIEYNLGGDYKKFTTDAGIDTESADNASCEFIIEADGKRLYKSPILKKWNWPQHIEVSVDNVRTMTLIVTDGGDGKNGDHADWLNPKLYK